MSSYTDAMNTIVEKKIFKKIFEKMVSEEI